MSGARSSLQLEKLQNYLQIETLEEYLMVFQGHPRVESFFHQPGGTSVFTPVEGLEMNLMVRSLGLEVPLREIFARIEFPPSLFGAQSM